MAIWLKDCGKETGGGAQGPAQPTLPSETKRSRIGTKVFIVCGVAALLFAQAWLFKTMLPTALGAGIDFVGLYRMGGIVGGGQAKELYRASVQQEPDANTATKVGWAKRTLDHPPFEALIFVPLARLPYRQAYWVWTLASAALLLAGSLALDLNPFVAFAFFPIEAALAQGQDSLLLFAILAFAFRQFRAGRETSAGALLGLGLFKFQFILPLVAILALRRRWKLVAGFAATGVVLAGISVLMVGMQGSVDYVRILTTHRVTAGYGLMPNVHGLVDYFGGRWWVTILLSGLIVAWSGIKKVSAKTTEFSLAIVATELVCFHGFVADLCLLLIPISAEFELGRWASVFFFATPVYLLLFERGMWSLIALPLIAFLFNLTFEAPQGKMA